MDTENEKQDAFICHANIDKTKCVDILVNHLDKRGVTYWYDKDCILVGDIVFDRIKEGIKNSRAGIVIFSEAFLHRDIPKLELGIMAFIDIPIILIFYKISRKKALRKINFLQGVWGIDVTDENDLERASNEIKRKIDDIKRNEEKRQKEVKKKGEKKRKRMIIIIIIIALSLLALLSMIYIGYHFIYPTHKADTVSVKNAQVISECNAPFDTSKGSYNVLLFPFQPLGNFQNKPCIENNIRNQLQIMNDLENLNLHIKYDSTACIHEFSEADSIGRKRYAHIVIWGDLYEQRFSDNKAAMLKYIIISDVVPEMNQRDTSEMVNFSSFSEIVEGKLLKDVDYIIHWVTASRAYSKKDFATALNLYKRIENTNKITVDLLFNIAYCYQNIANHLTEAKEYYEKTLIMSPGNFPAQRNYGLILQKTDTVEVVNYYRKTLKMYPKNFKVQLNYLCFLEDNGYHNNEIRKEYKYFLSINPNDPFLLNNFAVFLSRRYHELEQPEKLFKEAIRIYPKYSIAHANYANFLAYKSKDKDHLINAENQFEEALRLDPKNLFIRNKYINFLQSKSEDSLKIDLEYKKALNVFPNSADLRILYCIFLNNWMHNKHDAKVQYLLSFEIDPKYKSSLLDNYFIVEPEESYKIIFYHYNQTSDVHTIEIH